MIDMSATGKYYVVAFGRRCGIFLSWNKTRLLVNGHPYNQHQKFRSLLEAEKYLLRMLTSKAISKEHKIVLRRAMESMTL